MKIFFSTTGHITNNVWKKEEKLKINYQLRNSSLDFFIRFPFVLEALGDLKLDAVHGFKQDKHEFT